MWSGFNRYCFSGKRIPAGFAAGRINGFPMVQFSENRLPGMGKMGGVDIFWKSSFCSLTFLSGKYNWYFETNILFEMPPIAYSTSISFLSAPKTIPIGGLSPTVFSFDFKSRIIFQSLTGKSEISDKTASSDRYCFC